MAAMLNAEHESYSAKPRSTHLAYIDGLRGLSIIAVLLSHYFPAFIGSGHLGVDVFFVISGYVITKFIVESEFKSPAALLTTFYARRLRRLMPPLLFTVITVAMLLPVFLPAAHKSIYSSAAYSILGIANLQFYVQANDYFAVNMQLNPFTHAWSLGVEEQFYLVFPAVIALTCFANGRFGVRRSFVPVLCGVAAVSFMLWIWADRNVPVAAFYLAPLRLWELALGCLLFLVKMPAALPKPAFAANLALATLIAVLMQGQLASPISNVLACVATAVTLKTNETAKSSMAIHVLQSKAMTWIGKISYSLYLWHWPILIFALNVAGQALLAKLVAILLSVGLAVFSFNYLEKPFRLNSFRWSATRSIVTIGFAAVLSAAFVGLLLPKVDKQNYSLYKLMGIPQLVDWQPECHGLFRVPDGKAAYEYCLSVQRTPTKPKAIFLIGDSHAAHLLGMIQQAVQDSQFQLRFINTERVDDFPAAYFNAEPKSAAPTVDYINHLLRPGDVIVVSIHRGRFNPLRDNHLALSQPIDVNQREVNFVQNMGVTLDGFSRLGAHVLFVRDTPMMNTVLPVESCVLQSKIWGSNSCSVERVQDLYTRTRQDRSIDKLLGRHRNVSVWDPLPNIYGGKEKFDVIDANGNYLMRDWNHISEFQSKLLAPAFLNQLNALPVND